MCPRPSARALLIAFGDRDVVVRSDDADVMGALERTFALMRATSSARTVGELEVHREDGGYAVRENGNVVLANGSLADVVRCVRFSAIQFLMEARPDLLWFHAGVAASRGRAVLFPGPPGGGKSTVVTHLCALGWRYLSDEVAPLDSRSYTVIPFPQTPAVRHHPGREMPQEWLRMPNKRELEVRPGGLCREPAPVAAVVRLSYRRGARAELSVSSSATTALHLLEQSWNAPRHSETAVGDVCTLVQRVPGFSLSFSDGEAAADMVAGALGAYW